MLSPSSRRATKRRRSSITEHSFQGIATSRLLRKRKVLPMCPVRSVTYVSGRSQLAEEFKYSASQPVDGQAMTRYCKRHLPRPERLGISLIERFRIDVVLAGSDR